jgi:hypothetical protein
MREPLCVRCGRNPQGAESWLCARCRADDLTFQEMSEARRVIRRTIPTDDGREQRRYLVGVHHWAGGWPRIRT